MGGKRAVLFGVVALVIFSSLALGTEGMDENIMLSTYLDDIIYMGQEYTKLFKIEINGKKEARGCSEKDNITVYYNVTNPGLVKQDVFTREIGCSGSASTGEFTPSEPGNFILCGEIINSTVKETNFEDNFACMNFTVLGVSDILCDITLNITTDKLIYEKGESVKFKMELNNESFPFEIEYWIEDLFGNIYKNKYTSTNTNQKSWKTNIDEEDRILLIKAAVNSSCKDTNLENNYAEKMIIVTNILGGELAANAEAEESSAIEIKGVSPVEINFGDLVNVEVEIYKNSTGKYSLTARIEKDGKRISYETKFHLKSKNTAYKLFLPIQLKPNCDGKIGDGKASLVVEGLGEKAEKEITVSGVNEDFCKDSSAGDVDEKKELSYQIVDLPVSVLAGEGLDVVVGLKGDAKEHEYKAWGYLYRGSKCYSCEGGKERDSNLIEFELDENEEKEIQLLVKADEEMEEGEYKLKVKLNKDGQKTDEELTQSIYVKGKGAKEEKEKEKESDQSLCLLSGNSELVNKELAGEATGETTLKISDKKKEILNEIKGIVIYESSSEKAKNLIPYFLIAILALLCLILGWKRF